MDFATLREFEDVVRGQIPGFQVAFKNESKLQKVLGFLARPFNPGYMTDFATTLGTTVTFPFRAYYENSPVMSLVVLAHEFVHLWDQKQGSLRFRLSYIFPQVLGLLPLLAYGILAGTRAWILALPLLGYVLACLVAPKSKVLMAVLLALSLGGTFGLAWWLTGWKVFVLAAGVVCFGPWPAPGRVRLEKRGYTINIAVPYWLGYTVSPLEITSHFTTAEYFFMSWSQPAMDAYFEATRDVIRSGALQATSPYNIVYDFLYQRGLLRR
jgi:hypothetical protein